MPVKRHIYRDEVRRKETITIKVVSTPAQIVQLAIGSSLNAVTKQIGEFNRMRESYLNQGYTLKAQDTNNLTFIVEKAF